MYFFSIVLAEYACLLETIIDLLKYLTNLYQVLDAQEGRTKTRHKKVADKTILINRREKTAGCWQMSI